MTNPPGEMPPLPEPFGHIHDGNGNQPLSFDRGPIPWERSIGCSTQEVYSFAQLQAYAATLIARVAALEEALKSTNIVLHHIWCDAQLNEHSFERLNKQMEIVDAALTPTKD